ncbi:MAG TPA: flagellar basal body rod protein FlgB [Armatimonadota bacterium]
MALRNDLTTQVLTRSLDAAALRQRVAARNIANLETPGYHRQEVLFEDQLAAVLEAPSEGPASPELPQAILQDDPAPGRADGNNVSVDREMAELSENALRYDALLRSVAARGAILQTVITEGRK